MAKSQHGAEGQSNVSNEIGEDAGNGEKGQFLLDVDFQQFMVTFWLKIFEYFTKQIMIIQPSPPPPPPPPKLAP